MGKDLYENSEAAKKLLNQVVSIKGLKHLRDVIFAGPEELLTRTDNVQPAITTVSTMALVAVLEAADKAGRAIKPIACAGHSLGEYAAHVAAGNLTPIQAIKLTAARGAWMNEASQPPYPKGAMIAVMGLAMEKLEEIVAGLDALSISIANINSPGQIILSGEATAIAQASEAASAAGAKRVIPLNVSGAWHSPLMKGAQEKMEVLLSAEITPEKVTMNLGIPVIANATSAVVSSIDLMKETLGRQITSPVVWTECVSNLLTSCGYPGLPSENNDFDKPWPIFVEVGPGKVLRGLLRSIDKGLESTGVEDTATLNALLAME